jgi:hypothetical protein
VIEKETHTGKNDARNKNPEPSAVSSSHETTVPNVESAFRK